MNDLMFDHGAEIQRRPVNAEVAGHKQPVILQYLNVMKRRKWLLVGSVVVTTIVGLLITLLLTPMYTAETTVEIQREGYQIVNVQGVEQDATPTDLEFYETQWGLLRSRSLAERIATELRLYRDASFFEMFGDTTMADEIREGGAGSANASREERIRKATSILLENVSIAPTRLSRLVDVQFTSPDPDMSTRIANTWAQSYIEVSLERRFDATSYARNFLEERLEQLRQRLQESERALVGYAANERIINVPTSTSTGENVRTEERSLVAEDLTNLNRELNQATAARVAAQSRLSEGNGPIAEALGNQSISELRTRRAELAAEQAQLLAQFEPDYPPAKAMAEQIAELDRGIAREEARVRGSLRSNYEMAITRESQLQRQVSALENDLLDLRGRSIQYNIYQRDVDTNRQLYDALLQRYKEIGIAGGVGVNNISIVDRAQTPRVPSSPNLILNLLISILIGGVIGAGLALVLEQLDQSISNPREVEAALGLPMLGVIPKSEDEDDPINALEDPKTPLVEAYLSAQTRLAFSTDHGFPRTLAITSTRPAEGKSTTAYALARQLARSNNRVILIDGDMRSPSLHGMLGVDADRGLSNYLAGDDDWKGLTYPTPTGLTLMSAGPVPPNAAELLTGARFNKLMSELLKSFDHVIIDAPPVMGLADTPLIGSVVEGVLFIAESHSTPLNMARVAVSRLRDAKAHLVGVLLTKFAAEKAEYGYGYDYGYGYGRERAEPVDAA